MNKISVAALALSVISWVLFFSVTNNRFFVFVLILAVVSFAMGAASFYKINKASLIRSAIAVSLSMALAITLVVVMTLGSVVDSVR